MKLLSTLSALAMLATLPAEARVHRWHPVWHPRHVAAQQVWHQPRHVGATRHRALRHHARWHPPIEAERRPDPEPPRPPIPLPPPKTDDGKSPALYRLCKTTAVVLGIGPDMLSPYSIRTNPPKPIFSVVSPWAGALYPELKL
jgi:hypothetical protein